MPERRGEPLCRKGTLFKYFRLCHMTVMMRDPRTCPRGTAGHGLAKCFGGCLVLQKYTVGRTFLVMNALLSSHIRLIDTKSFRFSSFIFRFRFSILYCSKLQALTEFLCSRRYQKSEIDGILWTGTWLVGHRWLMSNVIARSQDGPL